MVWPLRTGPAANIHWTQQHHPTGHETARRIRRSRRNPTGARRWRSAGNLTRTGDVNSVPGTPRTRRRLGQQLAGPGIPVPAGGYPSPRTPLSNQPQHPPRNHHAPLELGSHRPQRRRGFSTSLRATGDGSDAVHPPGAESCTSMTDPPPSSHDQPTAIRSTQHRLRSRWKTRNVIRPSRLTHPSRLPCN